jgi:hypothetical protein
MPRSRAAAERLEGEQRVMAFLEERRDAEEDDEARKLARTTTTALAREELFFGRLMEEMAGQFSGRARKPGKVRKPKGQTDRLLNLPVSDIHFGADLDYLEVGHKYTAQEECRRLAHVFRNMAEYKLQYRDRTEAAVHLLGDLIQGQLHDPRDGRPLAAQVASTIGALVQGAEYLADAFPRGVTFRCVPGNHGRNKARHQQRAVNQKWDAIETMIYVALREAMRHFPNVNVEIGKKPFYTWRAFDKMGWATHGDTVLDPGFPGRSIKVEDVRNQANHINVVAGRKLKEGYDLFLCGHVHVASTTYLPEGGVFMTNSCLIPPDEYAVSEGLMEAQCGQQLFESVPGHIVGDARLIKVTEDVDADASLDSIIKPRGL